MKRGELNLPRRARLAAAVAALCALGIAGTTGAAAQTPAPVRLPTLPGSATVVQAPHYGDVLFRFFQQDHYAAVSALMVSQHFGRIAPHDDEAEVLRGGLLLSWGLHQEAGAVFARLIDAQTTPAVRDRAWFFLAKLRHQRGLWAEADDALRQVKGTLPAPLQEEAALLAGQLRLAQGDAAGAAQWLQLLPAGTLSADGAAFARFNLGVALVKSGQVAEGQALLDQLGQTPAYNEEQRALRDRANVALGFAALANQQPQAARNALQRVRLQGAQSNKALLGFGWAAAELKDHHAALVPWAELVQRDPSDAAVLEAHIARPYALAELGALRQALAAYETALAQFEQEDQRLQASIQALRDGALVQGLLEANPQAGLDAFSSLEQAHLGPTQPHASHLAPLLAQHSFQAAFRNLRELQFLQQQLDEHAQRLDAFHDLLKHRREAFDKRLPAVREQAGRSPLAQLQQRRETLAAELARAEASGDTEALARLLATAKEQDWLQRLSRGQATLQQSPNSTDMADTAERLRRVQGALTWQLAREAPARLWDTRKALRQTDQALADTQARDAALLRAQAEEPARFAAFEQRILALQQRWAGLGPQRVQLAQEQQQALQEAAVASLSQQRERLATYAAQARLAVAQLYDRAALAGTAPALPPRAQAGANTSSAAPVPGARDAAR